MKCIWREHFTLAHLQNEEGEPRGTRCAVILAWYDKRTGTLRIELCVKDFSAYTRDSFPVDDVEPLTKFFTVSTREEAIRTVILHADRYALVASQAVGGVKRDSPEHVRDRRVTPGVTEPGLVTPG